MDETPIVGCGQEHRYRKPLPPAVGAIVPPSARPPVESLREETIFPPHLNRCLAEPPNNNRHPTARMVVYRLR